MRPPLQAAVVRRSRAVVRDMKLLDLVRFFPGCPISTLHLFTSRDTATITTSLRLLAQAGLVEMRRDREKQHKGSPIYTAWPAGWVRWELELAAREGLA